MALREFLLERKSSIASKWLEKIVETYPEETAKFLKSQKDPFRNPVGSTISKGIENLLTEIIDDHPEKERVATFLDEIIRIRAIQDFSASEAVAFIFFVKEIIREEIEKAYSTSNISIEFRDELTRFEIRIDNLALLAFDIYMRCREKIYELQAREVKNMTYRLLQQAKLIIESPEKPM